MNWQYNKSQCKSRQTKKAIEILRNQCIWKILLNENKFQRFKDFEKKITETKTCIHFNKLLCCTTRQYSSKQDPLDVEHLQPLLASLPSQIEPQDFYYNLSFIKRTKFSLHQLISVLLSTLLIVRGWGDFIGDIH